MKIWLDEDDKFYPWFTPTEERPFYPRAGGKDGIDVDDATVERWQRVIAAAEVAQREMRDAAVAHGTWG